MPNLTLPLTSEERKQYREHNGYPPDRPTLSWEEATKQEGPHA